MIFSFSDLMKFATTLPYDEYKKIFTATKIFYRKEYSFIELENMIGRDILRKFIDWDNEKNILNNDIPTNHNSIINELDKIINDKKNNDELEIIEFNDLPNNISISLFPLIKPIERVKFEGSYGDMLGFSKPYWINWIIRYISHLSDMIENMDKDKNKIEIKKLISSRYFWQTRLEVINGGS